MSTVISNKVYDLIKKRFIAGQLLVGERISELAIAKELNISRSPIREAISQLVSEGLLEKIPGFGAFIKIPDRRDIEELFVLREMLECYAVRQAAGHINKSQLEQLGFYCDELLSIAKQMRLRPEPNAALTGKVLETDMGFHMQIVELVDNRQIVKIIVNCRILATIFSLYPRKQLGSKEAAEIWYEHVRIKQAIGRQDADLACEWMKKQIQRSRRLTLLCYETLAKETKIVSFSNIVHKGGQAK